MKILVTFGLIALVFAGCTSVEYQQMQNERERLRAAYEEARLKNDTRSVKNTLERDILGTWQFLDIEILESDLSNEIESAVVALDKLSRKNLTIRFLNRTVSVFTRVTTSVFGLRVNSRSTLNGSLRFYIQSFA